MDKNLYYLSVDIKHNLQQLEGIFNAIEIKEDHTVYHPVDTHYNDKVKSIIVEKSGDVKILNQDIKQKGDLCFIDDIDSENIIYLYGKSDDLIEIRGCKKDEYYYSVNNTTVSVNTTQVKYNYTADGIWDIEIIEDGRASNIDRYEFSSNKTDYFCNYSDLVSIEYEKDTVIEVDN